MNKLKHSEIKTYREKLLKEQNYICPLCNTKIEKGQDALDHDHETGHCRAVLHKICNTVEGKCFRWVNRSPNGYWGEVLNNLLTHWLKDYTHMPIHPKHKTSTEKEISRLRKRIKKLKTKRGKDRLKEKILKLKENGDST